MSAYGPGFQWRVRPAASAYQTVVAADPPLTEGQPVVARGDRDALDRLVVVTPEPGSGSVGLCGILYAPAARGGVVERGETALMVSTKGPHLELRNVLNDDGPVGLGLVPELPLNMVDPAFFEADQVQQFLTVGAGNSSAGFWAGTSDSHRAWLTVTDPQVDVTSVEALLTLR